MAGVASLMAAAEQGDAPATEKLFTVLYSELHRLAQREMARHGPSGGFGVTSLLHEAYLDMAGREGLAFPDRARFMGYACRVMRGLIIDYARSRKAQKRGGQFEITALTTGVEAQGVDETAMQRISHALDRLGELDPALPQIVDLKYFCGFTFDEIAAMQGVATRTVQRRWEKARLYLHNTIRADLSP